MADSRCTLWKVLLVVAIAVVPLFPVQANMFQPQDARPLDELSRRVLSIQQDNLEIERSLNHNHEFDAVQCIVDIDTYLVQVGDRIGFISTLLGISSVVENHYDESVVNRSLSTEIEFGLTQLPLAKQSANLSAGNCGSSAIVVNRAQVARSILDEIERALLLLNRHF